MEKSHIRINSEYSLFLKLLKTKYVFPVGDAILNLSKTRTMTEATHKDAQHFWIVWQINWQIITVNLSLLVSVFIKANGLVVRNMECQIGTIKKIIRDEE